MTQLSPELVTYNQGDTAPKRDETYLGSSPLSIPNIEEDYSQIERGYDTVAVQPEKTTTGSTEINPLLHKKIADVATITLVNPPKAFEAYESLKDMAAAGVDLESELPDVAVEDRPAVFVQQALTEKLSTNTGELLIGLDRTKIKSAELQQEESAQLKERDEAIEKLQGSNMDLRMAILKLRRLAVQSGVSEDTIQQFDLIAQILPAPQREALMKQLEDEAKTSAFEKVKTKARGVLSKIAIKKLGIFRPTSE